MVIAATGKPYEKALRDTIKGLKNNEFLCNIRGNKYTNVKIYDCLRQTPEKKQQLQRHE